MLSKLLLVLVAGIPAVHVLTHASHRRHEMGPSCGASTDEQALVGLAFVRSIVSDQDSGTVAGRAVIGFPSVDSSQVIQVTSDSVCRAAGITINRDNEHPDTTSIEVYLYSVASRRYIGQVKGQARYPRYVLDSTLTHVTDRLLR